MRRFLFLTLFALAVATSGWLIRGAIGDEDTTELFAPSVSVAIPEPITPVPSEFGEQFAGESSFQPAEDHSSAFDAGDDFAQAPRIEELERQVERLNRQADILARQGREGMAETLRVEAEALMAQRHEDEAHDERRRQMEATIETIERTADELAESGASEEAEHFREVLRGLQRLQHRREEMKDRRLAFVPGETEVEFDGESMPMSPQIHELHRKIEHLREAAENLEAANFSDQAHELRREAERMQVELQHQKHRHEQRIRELREHKERLLRERRELEERRHHPGNVAAALRDLRNEVRQLRSEVREMHKLLEKRHERAPVEEEIEEAEAFKPTPREQPTRRDSRRRSDPAPDFDDDPIEATPSNESVPVPETEIEETNTDLPAVETPAEG